MRKNDEFAEKKFPNINKKLFSRLDKYYKALEKEELEDYTEIQEVTMLDDENDEPLVLLAEQ